MKETKALFIETFGCAMNVRDTEHMVAELTTKEGYTLTDRADQADLILINTCSVREKPVAKLFSELGQFNRLKKAGARLGVCGCTASHLGDAIIQKAPYVDFVLGARNVSKITQVVKTKGAVEIATDFDESTYQFGEYRSDTYRAYVNISIGCDKECTFCIVPHTRGSEISIPADLVVAEAKRAVQSGRQEIFLLGQNVNNYGRRFSGDHPKVDFSDLLEMVGEVEGVERIRFTSPHPLHMDQRFMQLFASHPKICKHMHMPLQSGSSRILKVMKRGYTKEWFLEKAGRLRELAPDATIGTDVIVGFPGESEEDFLETMEVLEAVRFEQMFSFLYSPRPHTKAAAMPGQVDADIASGRLQRLQERHRQLVGDAYRSQEGKRLHVLFEQAREDGMVFGKSDNFFSVIAKGDDSWVGRIVPVTVTGIHKGALLGQIAA